MRAQALSGGAWARSLGRQTDCKAADPDGYFSFSGIPHALAPLEMSRLTSDIAPITTPSPIVTPFLDHALRADIDARADFDGRLLDIGDTAAEAPVPCDAYRCECRRCVGQIINDRNMPSKFFSHF